MSKDKVSVGGDVGGNKIAFHVRGRDGSPLVNDLTEFPSHIMEGPEVALPRWRDAMSEFLKGLGLKMEDAAAACFATPGPAPQGKLERSANFPAAWVGTDIPARLKELLGIPVAYENDGNAAGLGEALMIPEAKNGIVAFLGVGTGIGGCLCINHRVIGGTRGAAAELGHVQIRTEDFWPADRPAFCGRRCPKCAEAFACLAGLELNLLPWYAEQGRLEGHAGLDTGSMKERAYALRAAAMNGDEVALEIFDLQAKVLGRLARQIAVTVDPDYFIIGGGITYKVDDTFKARIMRGIQASFEAEAPFEIQLVGRPASGIQPIQWSFAKVSDLAGALGASGIAHQLAVEKNLL